jgi:hypothetical protein
MISLDTAGKWIDIAFFGLNQNFGYNKFISPDSAEAYTFNAKFHRLQKQNLSTHRSCVAAV